MNLKTLSIVASVLMSGCSVLSAPNVETWEYTGEAITVKAIRDQTRQIKWLQVPNDQVQAICLRVTKGRFGTKRIAACASWNQTEKTCTVITGMETTTSNLGHEIRHCYDGDFHD